MSRQARVQSGVPVGGQFTSVSRGEAEVSLAPAKKKSSKGLTTTVTFEDGTVATRTSKNGNYTHAVVVSAEIPERVIEAKQASIRELQARNELLAAALENPILKKRNRRLGGGDPDIGYDGLPRYHGFEAVIFAPDGKTQISSTWCNSKGISKGVYDYETGKFDGEATQPASRNLINHVRDEIRLNEESIESARRNIEAVKEGTYKLGGPQVVRWSSREDLAVKAATGEFDFFNRTRRVSVRPVDQ